MENEITTTATAEVANVTTEIDIFDDGKFSRMHELAKIMASGKCAIPKHLQGSEGDCFAVIMQSMQWGMNPFAVAQKTHVVNGALGYEAQLVNAVVTATGAITSRFQYEYVGDWDAYRASGFSRQKEAGCGVNVGAILRGETAVRWLPAPLFMETVKTRNSPLWTTNPMQQLAYLAVKFWARLYTPDAILGVYSDDELADAREMVNITPAPAPAPAATGKTEALKKKLGVGTVDVPPEMPELPPAAAAPKKRSEIIAAEIAAQGAPVKLDEVLKYLADNGIADVDDDAAWSLSARRKFDADPGKAVSEMVTRMLDKGLI